MFVTTGAEFCPLAANGKRAHPNHPGPWMIWWGAVDDETHIIPSSTLKKKPVLFVGKMANFMLIASHASPAWQKGSGP